MNIYSHQNQYIDNKFTKWYYSIITSAQLQNRKRLKKSDENYVYYERHHILPRCWFPEFEKEKWNLVFLTAHEHYICHRLLAKMTFGLLKSKMVLSLSELLRKSQNQDRWVPSGRAYQYIREELAKIVPPGAWQKGNIPWNKDKKMSNDFCNSIRKGLSQLDRSGKNNSFYGRSHSDEFKKKQSAVCSKLFKGKLKSEETKRKMSEAAIKRWQKKSTIDRTL